MNSHVRPLIVFGMANEVRLLVSPEGAVTLINSPLLDHQDRVQKFFAVMADETRKPHFGDMQRGWMMAVLTRAQEAGLYTPPPKENA